MSATLNTNGSAIDTVLAVYKSGPNGLQQIACDDDSGDGVASLTHFGAAAGTAYYIQIGGLNSQTGQILFNYSFHLANDFFGNALTITPGFTAAFNTLFARKGKQSGEPSCSGGITNTVWYKYKPTANRRVSLDTFDSDFDSKVAVYTGASLAGLTTVVCADDTDESDGDASVTWAAVKNKTYYIQVGGYPHENAPYGAGAVRVNFVRLP
jgi:hypothetical protein